MSDSKPVPSAPPQVDPPEYAPNPDVPLLRTVYSNCTVLDPDAPCFERWCYDMNGDGTVNINLFFKDNANYNHWKRLLKTCPRSTELFLIRNGSGDRFDDPAGLYTVKTVYDISNELKCVLKAHPSQSTIPEPFLLGTRLGRFELDRDQVWRDRRGGVITNQLTPTNHKELTQAYYDLAARVLSLERALRELTEAHNEVFEDTSRVTTTLRAQVRGLEEKRGFLRRLLG